MSILDNKVELSSEVIKRIMDEDVRMRKLKKEINELKRELA